jgi:hypothetical protein
MRQHSRHKLVVNGVFVITQRNVASEMYTFYCSEEGEFEVYIGRAVRQNSPIAVWRLLRINARGSLVRRVAMLPELGSPATTLRPFLFYAIHGLFYGNIPCPFNLGALCTA